MIFNINPIDIEDITKKRAIQLFLLYLFCNAAWLGLWIYDRLQDLWLLNFETIYTHYSLLIMQLSQLLFFLFLGLVFFCILFVGAILGNIVILHHYHVPWNLINRFKLTILQFNHSPFISIILFVVELITGTYYYDRGFLLYPFIMAALFFLWMAYLNLKVYRGLDSDKIDVENVGKKTSLILFILYTAGFCLLFLTVPLLIKGPYDTLYTIIW